VFFAGCEPGYDAHLVPAGEIAMNTVRSCANLSLRYFAGFVAVTTFTCATSAVWAQASGSQSNRQRNVPPAQYQNQNQNAPTSDQQFNQQFNQQGRGQSEQSDQSNNRSDQYSRSADRTGRSNQAEQQENAAWLGVFLSQRDTNRGATVEHVYPAGPAARAGLERDDVIQQINGQQVTSGDDLVSALEQMHPGDKAEITVLRNNEPTKLTATLGNRGSYVSHGRGFGGQGGSGGQSDDYGNFFNIPLHAMDREYDRRNAEQHQRIETEIAKLREEVRQLREALQRR
jgi:hypothetical protein